MIDHYELPLDDEDDIKNKQEMLDWNVSSLLYKKAREMLKGEQIEMMSAHDSKRIASHGGYNIFGDIREELCFLGSILTEQQQKNIKANYVQTKTSTKTFFEWYREEQDRLSNKQPEE